MFIAGKYEDGRYAWYDEGNKTTPITVDIVWFDGLETYTPGCIAVGDRGWGLDNYCNDRWHYICEW